MPISASSGHPVAGGDTVPADLMLSADGTYRQIDVGHPRPGTILPSVNGGSGRSTTPATPLNNLPNNPSATSSTTKVTMGLGSAWAYIPSSSGYVHVVIVGQLATATAAAAATVGARYGTGGAPTNGTADTGTAFGSKADFTITGTGIGLATPFAFTATLTLTAGTAYWFDVSVSTSNASDAASVSNLSISAYELY
jgi:hypothetical protein